MKFVTYEIEHKRRLGVINRDGTWIYPLRSLDMDYKTMQELIEGISESEKQLLEYVSGQDPYKIKGAVPAEEAILLAPIPHPVQDVICLGINYMPMQRNRPAIRRSLWRRAPLPYISQNGSAKLRVQALKSPVIRS